MKNIAKIVFGCVCLVIGVRMVVEGMIWELSAQEVAGMILMLLAYVWVWVQASKR